MRRMWRRRGGTVGETAENVGVVAGMNLDCYFLFLMAADITCRPGQTCLGMGKATGRR